MSLRRRSPQARHAVVNDTSMSRGRPERFRGAGWTLGLRSDVNITLNGGDVSGIGDYSGNGRDLAQATGANQPLYVTNAYNGRPCIRLTAANSDNLARANTNLFAAGPYSFFAAWKCNSGTDAQAFWSNDTGAAGLIIGTFGATDDRNIAHIGQQNHVATTMQTTAAEIWGVTYPAAGVPTLRLNGVVAATTGTAGLSDPGGTATVIIGARFTPASFADLDFLEFHAFTTELTASQGNRLYRYMAARNGI